MENKNKNKSLIVTFRLYETDDILRFEKWKKELANSGESVSNAISDIVKQYLLEKDKSRVFNEVRQDLFYQMRKVMYSSLAPFSANIIRELLKNRVEEIVANKKLDVILNELFDDKRNELKNLTNNQLAESTYFENIRTSLESKTSTKVEKINEKVANVKDKQKQVDKLFKKDNTDWDAEITTLTHQEVEYNPYVNLDEIDINELV
ncbi:integrative conjugal element protein [Mycoplasma cottewii]|uniref:Integrative conjugal element protein n=1 Tax=Mycoplasma cottewii TaxID=51364 RepID=A0ABY5TVS3_9MOLU|nr:integrative conjugal element protein [Mycoplasma cottewii]UWD34759.1 integrative conjugal element protein [Mycoplasma cottewii]